MDQSLVAPCGRFAFPLSLPGWLVHDSGRCVIEMCSFREVLSFEVTSRSVEVFLSDEMNAWRNLLEDLVGGIPRHVLKHVMNAERLTQKRKYRLIAFCQRRPSDYEDHFHQCFIDAVEEGWLKLVRCFIQSDIDINHMGPIGVSLGSTVLHRAAEQANPNALTIVSELIGGNSDINLRNVFGYSPLHLAVMSGTEPTVEHLVAVGVDIDAIVDFFPESGIWQLLKLNT